MHKEKTGAPNITFNKLLTEAKKKNRVSYFIFQTTHEWEQISRSTSKLQKMGP